MKKTLKFALGLVILVMAFSCSDDDDDKVHDLVATEWTYKSSHVVFDTKGEDLLINSGNNESITLNEEIVKAKMDDVLSKFFKGINFIDESDMNINVGLESLQISLNADYKINDKYISVLLDKEQLEEMFDKEMPIPEISFNYSINGQTMNLYLDKMALSLMIQPMIPMIAKLMTPNFDTMPEEVQTGIIAGVQAIIKDITDKTGNVEIGVNLSLNE